MQKLGSGSDAAASHAWVRAAAVWLSSNRVSRRGVPPGNWIDSVLPVKPNLHEHGAFKRLKCAAWLVLLQPAQAPAQSICVVQAGFAVHWGEVACLLNPAYGDGCG